MASWPGEWRAASSETTPPANTTSGRSVRSEASGSAPGRSTAGGETVRSSTVDSRPAAHGPPSRTSATSSPNARATCAAVVGESVCYLLALGAASGAPTAASSACATGCAGARIATVGFPPTAPPAATARAARSASAGRARSAPPAPGARVPAGRQRRRLFRRRTWAISGCVAGRPLAAKIRASDASERARPPRP